MIDTASRLEAILGRREWRIDLEPALSALSQEVILVTGAQGSLGCGVVPVLEDAGIKTIATDRDDLNVHDALGLMEAFADYRPTVVLHLAGAKHAPLGELEPKKTIRTNVLGTDNVLCAAEVVGARVVTASTCKACNPETVYGATKLLAERLTLEAGGSVARFFNVVETCGNVFDLWSALPENAPIPVTPCQRYFISLQEATSLLIWTAASPPGRYIVHPGRRPRVMSAVAAAAYPDRPMEFIDARRGDRQTEPLIAADETMTPMSDWLWRVAASHDREATTECA